MRRIITILIACFLVTSCETKESGKQVRDYVREMILDKEVIIKTTKDKTDSR